MRPPPTHLAVFAILSLSAACSEPPAASLVAPELAISDGAHQGNERFFFLPPMVGNPDAAGTFDGSLEPDVEVCVWDGAACGATLAVFNTAVGHGSETVRVSETDEHYVVNWHTEEILDNYTLGIGETYRIRVLAEGQELGFADLAVVNNGRELKNVQTDEFVPLLDGRTLPIKFRIEDGALADASTAEIASAGFAHSCAVAANGDGYCWGRNVLGELGTGTVGGSFNTPQPVSGGHTWQSIQASSDHTCGLTTDGAIYCWGWNGQGNLGLGFRDFGRYPTPQPVIGGHTFASLASLGSGTTGTSCGVTADGDMYCWGRNADGELGRGTFTTFEASPGLVIGGHSFNGSAGINRQFTCAVTATGDALCWGRNDFGQLGRGTITLREATPALVTGGYAYETITAGRGHACGLDAGGAARCWGSNSNGELGTGASSGPLPTPQPVSGGHTFAQLSAGWVFGCGVRTDGAGLCWGLNSSGQLGNGVISQTPPFSFATPGLVVGGHTFQSIGAGFGHACGVRTDGVTLCWGRNNSGALGDGTFSNNGTPQFAIDLDP